MDTETGNSSGLASLSSGHLSNNYTSLGYRDTSAVERYAEAVVLATIALLGGSHNLLILVAGFSKPKLQRGINILVLNMAAVDFLANAIVYPLYACAIIRGYYPFGMVGCKIEAVFALQDIAVSVFTNFAIAVNRCAMTKHKRSFAHRLTSTRVTLAWVVTSWVFPILVCTGPIACGFIELEYHFAYNTCLPAAAYHNSPAFQVYSGFYHLAMYGPLFGAIVCYIVVWRRVKSMTFSKRSEVSRKRYLRTTQNVAIIFLVFCVCWVPDTLHWLIDPDYQLAPVWVTRAGVILYFANSAINPFLFAWRFPVFRKTMVNMLSTRAQRRASLISTYRYVTERRNPHGGPGADKTTISTTYQVPSSNRVTETDASPASNNNKPSEVTCYVSAM